MDKMDQTRPTHFRQPASQSDREELKTKTADPQTDLYYLCFRIQDEEDASRQGAHKSKPATARLPVNVQWLNYNWSKEVDAAAGNGDFIPFLFLMLIYKLATHIEDHATHLLDLQPTSRLLSN
jgi:hypothetical protein